MNTCIKISAFACLHPRSPSPPGILPSDLLPDPFRTPLLRFSCLYTMTTMSSTSSSRVCMYDAKMSSDLERASRMLTFPARRGMITFMTYIGGSAIMYPHRHRFYPRERQSMQIKELAKRTLFSDTDSCDLSLWNYLSVPSTRSRT